MSNSWEFKQSLFTNLSRSRAWAFWSDMQNHARLEAVTIELDGPFHSGTKGRTITQNSRQEWWLDDVIHEKRFVVTGEEAGVQLSFAWEFDDEGTGTRMTQVIRATGPASEMKKWHDTLRQMEVNAPKGLEKLANELNSLNHDEPESV